MSLMNRPVGGEQPVMRGVFCIKPSSCGAGDGQPGPYPGTPMSTVVSTTAMWRFGRPVGNASSARTSFGKFAANTVWMSDVPPELSITNSRSRSFVITCSTGTLASGMARPPCEHAASASSVQVLISIARPYRDLELEAHVDPVDIGAGDHRDHARVDRDQAGRQLGVNGDAMIGASRVVLAGVRHDRAVPHADAGFGADEPARRGRCASVGVRDQLEAGAVPAKVLAEMDSSG